MAESRVAGAPKIKSVNAQIFDDLTVHVVEINRFEADMQRRILRMLNRLEKSLLAELGEADPTGIQRTAWKQKRLEKLLDSTRATIKTAYLDIRKEHLGDLKELAGLEGEVAADTLSLRLPDTIKITFLAPEQLKVLATDTLIAGAPTAEWWADQAGDLRQRFKNAMREGMARGEGMGDLVRRVRGTKAGNFTDGIMRTTRNHAEMLVRSSVQTVANRARENVWEANSDLIKALVWRSTLDTRTSTDCIARDGLRYTVGEHEPIGHSLPWGSGPGSIHRGCRSTSIPVVKSWRELGMDADDIPTGTRSSLDGYVPAKTTYREWLEGQSKETQERVLGKKKAQLLRQGEIDVKDLINSSGRPLRLEELKAIAKAA